MIKAGKAKRILAVVLDYLIIAPVILFIVTAGLPDLIKVFSENSQYTLSNVWSFLNFLRWLLVGIISICAYFTLVPVIIPGQTLGKKLLRIRVVKKNGERVTFTTMFVREIIGRLLFDFTSFLLTVFLSLILMISPYHEALHDTLADTVVINT